MEGSGTVVTTTSSSAKNSSSALCVSLGANLRIAVVPDSVKESGGLPAPWPKK
jgi:hypothetical protein